MVVIYEGSRMLKRFPASEDRYRAPSRMRLNQIKRIHQRNQIDHTDEMNQIGLSRSVSCGDPAG